VGAEFVGHLETPGQGEALDLPGTGVGPVDATLLAAAGDRVQRALAHQHGDLAVLRLQHGQVLGRQVGALAQ
jgi:hypothetical protein